LNMLYSTLLMALKDGTCDILFFSDKNVMKKSAFLQFGWYVLEVGKQHTCDLTNKLMCQIFEYLKNKLEREQKF
jgi:hypothetical protein